MNMLDIIDTPVGSYAPDFELPGIDQQVHHLGRYLHKCQAIAVISMANSCSYVKFYLERLKQLQMEFAPFDFTVIGVNGSNTPMKPMENFEQMKTFALSHELNFPYLWDPTQDVTRSFGARKTPTAFLVDKKGVIRYKGLIDDSPKDPTSVRRNYLKDAVAALIAGKEITITETEPVGTSLIWRN